MTPDLMFRDSAIAFFGTEITNYSHFKHVLVDSVAASDRKLRHLLRKAQLLIVTRRLRTVSEL